MCVLSIKVSIQKSLETYLMILEYIYIYIYIYVCVCVCVCVIPTIREKKREESRSLLLPTTYWSKSAAGPKKQLQNGLRYIDKCDLMNKDKIWCIYFGLILKLPWPLQIYEVSLTKVETMERLISKFILKNGIPNSLTNVAQYSSSAKLKLPTLLLVEEYKLGKMRLFQMLRDSRDPLVKNAQPSVINSRKWKAKIAVENAESALRMKEIISTEANGKASLGLHPQRWCSNESSSNRRKMVSEEIHHLEEVGHFATSVA